MIPLKIIEFHKLYWLLYKSECILRENITANENKQKEYEWKVFPTIMFKKNNIFIAVLLNED